jgi:hypothetical protein
MKNSSIDPPKVPNQKQLEKLMTEFDPFLQSPKQFELRKHLELLLKEKLPEDPFEITKVLLHKIDLFQQQDTH